MEATSLLAMPCNEIHYPKMADDWLALELPDWIVIAEGLRNRLVRNLSLFLFLEKKQYN